MKDYLIILYSKAIDGTLLIQLKANSTVGIVDKAIDKLYESQYIEYKNKGYSGSFDSYINNCLQSDNLCHIATIQEPKRIVDAEYYSI